MQRLKRQIPQSERIVGNYRIIGVIESSGLDQVCEAIEEPLGRKVQLRLIASALLGNPSILRRFRREAQALAAIKHPNIVQIYAVGKDAQHHYIAQEFVEGISLRERLSKGPLTFNEIQIWFNGLLGGIGAVHQAGLIHRDIRPNTVRLDRAPIAKIVDFGLVKPLMEMGECTNTTQGIMFKDLSYLAPEVMSGNLHSIQSDVYSLGIVLYEMSTGVIPFKKKDLLGRLQEIMENSLPSVRDVNPTLPAGLVPLLKKMTDPDPNKRFPSLEELKIEWQTTVRG